MSKRILVVEDQPDNRQIIRDMLAPTDYEITEVESGEEALAAVAKQRHDEWIGSVAPTRATMIKLVSIAALLGFVTLSVSVPAFAQSAKCLAFCAKECAGKAAYCTIHCQQVAKACK